MATAARANPNVIKDKNVLKVVYPKNKNANNKYDAIGCYRVFLKKEDPRNEDKCAFSQYKLKECDSISVLIYAQNNHNATGNQWKFLCDGDFCKVHIFDTDFLKQWMDLKGTEFVSCPLCKSGIEEKQSIEEHDAIGSMEQLSEKREEAKKENDINMQFHFELLILDKCVSELWTLNETQSKLSFNKSILNSVLKHWISKKKLLDFRERVVEALNKAIAKDNLEMVKILLSNCHYLPVNKELNDQRNAEYLGFMRTAAKCASFECMSYLLTKSTVERIDWSAEKRPSVLLNAVKFHPENLELINHIIDKLELLKITFVCDDIMEQIIKFDLVDTAKRIVNNRWHKICEKDESLAKQINLNCHHYFNERNAAFSAFDPNGGNEDGLNWDDDEWGEDDQGLEDDDFAAEDFDDDDGDWQQADLEQEDDTM